MAPTKILIVDDDENLRWVLETQLSDSGYDVIAASDGQQALTMLESETPEAILTDLRMGGMSGMDLLKEIRRNYPDIPVILMTAFGTIQNAVEAVKSGAYDYLTKPIDYEDMFLVLQRAVAHSKLVEEVQTLRAGMNRKYGFESIIGHSEALLSLLDMAMRAARSSSTILISAETGTGKELLARAIHQNSARKDKPFVTINCGAIPRELLESELFGHVKGAFTGALAHKKGRIELAHEGTLFLDEIGEMPGELQVKLLRLIQQGEIEKVGAPAPSQVDVRIVAATHRNLQAMIEDETFREDLYYRLAVIPLELPPLRDRIEDIPELVQHFFLQAKEKIDRKDIVLSPDVIPYLQSYRWPGNIRELENIVERLVVLSPGNEIRVSDLPEMIHRERRQAEESGVGLPSQGISLESVEKDLILRALIKFNWNQTHAARFLDISRKALMYRMEKHGLRKPGGADSPSEEEAL